MPAPEGVMSREQLNNPVPSFEYDHRARDARLHFEHAGRMLVVRSPRKMNIFRGLRQLVAAAFGKGRRIHLSTRSLLDRRPCEIAAALSGSGLYGLLAVCGV